MDVLFSDILKIDKIRGLDQGLLHGNTGLTILLYAWAKAEQNGRLERMADDLLDEVFNGMTTVVSPDFEQGIAGVAWGMEYMLRKGYVEGDSDSILEDIDHWLFACLNDNKDPGFEFTNGLCGTLMYLSLRLQSYPDNPSLNLRIDRELFIHCINQIGDSVFSQLHSIQKDVEFDLFWRFPMLFLCVINALRLNIYNEKIERMFNQWTPSLEVCLPCLHINRLYLAIAFYRAGSILNNSRIDEVSKLLLFSTDVEQLRMEVNFDSDKIRYGYNGFLWVLHQAGKHIPGDYPRIKEIRWFEEEINTEIKSRTKNLFDSLSTDRRSQLDLCESCIGIFLWNILTEQLFEERSDND
ncbi:MAG: lanthionine synthetase LanC family protein [Mangrovibacterium sp.]